MEGTTHTHFVAIERLEMVEVAAKDPDEAVAVVVAQLEPRIAAASKVYVAREVVQLDDGNYGIKESKEINDNAEV